MFNSQAPFFVVLSFVLFSIACLGSTASFFEVHVSSTGSSSVTGHICPNYTPIVGIDKYYSTVLVPCMQPMQLLHSCKSLLIGCKLLFLNSIVRRTLICCMTQVTGLLQRPKLLAY